VLGLASFLAVACTQDTPLQPTAPPPVPPPPPTAGNRTPIAAVRVSWQGQEGESSAGLDAAGSVDPDGDSLYYTWNWGDGTAITGTNQQQAHSYWDNGTYRVTLTVTDNHGAAATASTLVTIGNATPWITVAQLVAPAMPATVPITATMRVAFQDRGVNDNPQATVDWGDGTSSGDSVHVYRVPGAYVVTVTVTDKDGASATQQIGTRVWVYDPGQIPAIPGYEVFDLGTLGGAEAIAESFNDRAEIVGSSTLADGKRHAFLWRDGVMTDLTPAGQDVVSAARINDAGWIAGSTAEEFSGAMPMWKDGVFTGFATVPSSEFGPSPVKIAQTGDVLLNINKHEYPTAVLLRGGTATAIGSFAFPSGGHSSAEDMNTRGQVVGSADYQAAGAQFQDFRAFLWEDGRLSMLQSLGTSACQSIPEHQCGFSAALDINEAGQIVGYAYDGTNTRAVSWSVDGHIPQDLQFGAGQSQALAVNERGQIAGDNATTGEGYFVDDGIVISLGSLGGGATRVAAMNEDGSVVGTSKTAAGETHAFVWRRATGMQDLGAGPYGGRHIGTGAIAINERGDVLGYAAPCVASYGGVCYSWGQTRAILWRRVN